MKYLIPILLYAVAGCATSKTDIFENLKPMDSKNKDLHYKECESAAYNAGYVRKGGLLGDRGRVDFLMSCLEKKGWKKK